ncbi:MAG: hypothetical protein Q4D38_06475 [Planctomycetia bacterium]|nr:hypothetical protein [Planctomycetia bacterium]
MNYRRVFASAIAILACFACFCGTSVAAPTDEEVKAAIEVFEKRMAPYKTDADGNVVFFDLTDRICTNEDLAIICKLSTVTQCKIYGANLKPGGADVIKGLTNCKKLSIENTDFVDADMAFLADMPWVEELTLRRNTYLGTETLSYVSKMPKLRNLVLLYGNFDDSALAELAPIKTLRLLDVRGCSAVTDAGLEVLKGLPNLIVVKLRCTAVTNMGIQNVEGKSLKTFDIEDSQTFSDEAIPLLAAMKDSLQEIIIMRCIAVSDNGIKLLGECTNMRKMNLRGNYIGGDALEACKNMPNLNLLIVSETFVDDSGVAHLENLTKLETLDLWNTLISDAAAESIAKITSLKKLSVVGTQISDAGVAQIATLPNLESLDLGETQTTDASVEALCGMKSLKTLSLRATSVSMEGAEKIRAALPNCTVTQ